MIQEIIQMFKDLTPILWISQILGIIGFIVIVISFQLDKLKYLIVSSIAIALFILEEIFASLYTNVITTSVALIRNCFMCYFLIKHKKELPKPYIIALASLMVISGIIYLFLSNNQLNILEYMPLVTALIFTILLNNKNYYIVKFGVLFNEISFMIYYYICDLPFSFLRQLFLAVAFLLSIITLFIKDKNKKTIKE